MTTSQDDHGESHHHDDDTFLGGFSSSESVQDVEPERRRRAAKWLPTIIIAAIVVPALALGVTQWLPSPKPDPKKPGVGETTSRVASTPLGCVPTIKIDPTGKQRVEGTLSVADIGAVGSAALCYYQAQPGDAEAKLAFSDYALGAEAEQLARSIREAPQTDEHEAAQCRVGDRPADGMKARLVIRFAGVSGTSEVWLSSGAVCGPFAFDNAGQYREVSVAACDEVGYVARTIFPMPESVCPAPPQDNLPNIPTETTPSSVPGEEDPEPGEVDPSTGR